MKAAWVLLLGFLVACDGGTSDDAVDADGGRSAPEVRAEDAAGAETAADAAAEIAGDPDADPVVGAFQVQLFEPVLDAQGRERIPGQTWVVGRVFDGPTPQPTRWDEVAAEGACRLWVPRVPYCPTPCTGGAVCVDDGSCQAYPAWVDVGPARLSGVTAVAGGAEVSIHMGVNGFYQVDAGSAPAYPPFAEGDPVMLTADGAGAVPGFTVEAAGIEQLVIDGGDLVLTPGQALHLAWTPAADPGRSRMHMEFDISHHGGLRGLVVCDTADTGALDVSAALLDALADLGTSGYPVVLMRRENVGAASTTAGRVELRVQSYLEVPLEIPGLVSCLGDADCPAGQTCAPNKACW